MNISWSLSDNYFSLEFNHPVKCLSSAIFGGGMRSISSFINLRVDENFGGGKTDFPPPEQTLRDAVSINKLTEPAAGMMTAASMNSFQYSFRSLSGIDIYCFLTSGLSNVLAAGDPGEFMPRQMFSNAGASRAGTINIAAGVSCRLTDAALAEALMIVTEAKSSVLYELGVGSIVSDRMATGTGTDSILVFSAGEDDSEAGTEAFCGKHTVLGELIADGVRGALFESLKKDSLFI